jgi:hypothetical protein
MANIVAFLVFLLVIPTVWWIYGARGLASAAWTGIGFSIPILLGALAGLVAAMVSTAVGASTRATIGFAMTAAGAAGLRMVLRHRGKKSKELGVPLEPSGPPTDVDYVWVPPQDRFFKCAQCGYVTEEADRPWGILQTTGACPQCGTPKNLPDARSKPTYEESLQSLRQLRESGAISEREYLEKVLDLAEKLGS